MTKITLTPKQIALARNALGLPNVHKKSYRNRYVVPKQTPNHAEWMDLVAQGAATCTVGDKVGDRFHLTRAGATSVLYDDERLDPEDFPGGEN